MLGALVDRSRGVDTSNNAWKLEVQRQLSTMPV